jgi:hypothetical protein
MSRIIYPEDFLSQDLLLRNIADKNASVLPPNNPLTAYLAQHSIDLADDVVTADAATAFENTRKTKAGEAENLTQKRNLAFETVFGNVRNYYQFLKKFYSPNFMELNLWGAPITVGGRIAYPNEFVERTAIYYTLKEKNDSYGPGLSPLDAYLTQHGQTMAANTAAVASALNYHNESKLLAGQAEDATQDRNNIWNPVLAHMRGIGGFLISLYSDNAKELNLWGFTVDDSPRAPKQVKSKVLLLSQITVSNLVVGGTLKNLGTVPLTVYKGNSATGSAVTVNPGELYGITKGYSTITVANPSPTTTGQFSTLRYR